MVGGLLVRGAAGARAVAARLRGRARRVAAMQGPEMERVLVRLRTDLLRHGLRGQAGSDAFWGKTGAAGDQLAVVTGDTRRTIATAVFRRAAHVIGVMGSPLRSFAMHEFGGVVLGKPLLRIPTRWMKKPSGQDRLQGRSARTLPNTRLFRSRAGNLFIWEVGTARARAAGGALPLYLLKPSIRLRARHMLGGTLRRNLGMIRASFATGMARVVRGR